MTKTIAIETPFGDELVEELHLPNAPLARVLCQLRYPKMPEVTRDPGVPPLRERLKTRYPILREDRAFALVVTSAGVASQPDQGELLWRLVDQDNVWTVTVSDSFIALETSNYVDRADYFDRLDEVVKAVAETYEPILYDRLGIRYVNRLQGEKELASLHRYVNPALLAGPLTDPPPGVELSHSLSQFVYQFSDAGLTVQWGVLPAGASLDPSLPAATNRSWTLDIDVFSPQGDTFSPPAIGQRARQFSERAYRFFRWATTADFLKEVGGLS
ncbi:MAG: TIGR04255 family protein [Acidimicrobiales bacterium]